MINSPSTELSRFALALFLGLIAGIVLDAVTLSLLIVVSGYLAWYFRQLQRLYTWLHSDSPKDPPESHGLWGTVFDLTHKVQKRQLKYRARLKKVIKRFRDSTYALKDGFVMLDRDGVIDWWNPAAARLIGLRHPQDREQPILNLLRDPEFKRYLQNKEFEKPIKLQSPINAELELELHLALFGKRDLLMIVRDVTELDRLERVRTDFVANVSHELKTPLTVLDGYLENLTDNTDIIHPRWHSALQQMLHQTRRMKALIQDLLMLSKLESRSTENPPQPVDMGHTIQQVCTDLIDVYQKRNQQITIDIETDLQLLGHPDELYSLTSNLLINASKYSPENKPIVLRWSSERNAAHLAVIDQGIGIADIDISRLTERFYRAEKGRSRNVGGTGLGLAIVKHILINHDATLSIKSKLGEGSTFTCEFPETRLVNPPKEITTQAS